MSARQIGELTIKSIILLKMDLYVTRNSQEIKEKFWERWTPKRRKLKACWMASSHRRDYLPWLKQILNSWRNWRLREWTIQWKRIFYLTFLQLENSSNISKLLIHIHRAQVSYTMEALRTSRKKYKTPKNLATLWTRTQWLLQSHLNSSSQRTTLMRLNSNLHSSSTLTQQPCPREILQWPWI